MVDIEFENFNYEKKNHLVGNLNIGASKTIGNYIFPQKKINTFLYDN